MKLLVLGSSHCGIIYKAKDILEESRIFKKIEWLVTGGNITFMTNLESGIISPPEQYLKNVIEENRLYICTDSPVLIQNYDIIYYNSLGIRPHGVYLNHPIYDVIHQPLSDSLFKEIIENDSTLNSHFQNIKQIRSSGFFGKIFFSRWIRPHELIEGIQINEWERFCNIESLIIDSFSSQYNLENLGYPPNEQYLTSPELVSDKKSHAVHGNEEYGCIINKMFIESLEG